jgi:hypothetical protein
MRHHKHLAAIRLNLYTVKKLFGHYLKAGPASLEMAEATGYIVLYMLLSGFMTYPSAA